MIAIKFFHAVSFFKLAFDVFKFYKERRALYRKQVKALKKEFRKDLKESLKKAKEKAREEHEEVVKKGPEAVADDTDRMLGE